LIVRVWGTRIEKEGEGDNRKRIKIDWGGRCMIDITWSKKTNYLKKEIRKEKFEEEGRGGGKNGLKRLE